MNTENTKDRVFEKQGSPKNNGNYKGTAASNQKEIADISRPYNEERRLGKFNSHKTY